MTPTRLRARRAALDVIRADLLALPDAERLPVLEAIQTLRDFFQGFSERRQRAAPDSGASQSPQAAPGAS